MPSHRKDRRYTYETTLDLPTIGERDVKVTFECPDFDMVENIDVVSIEGLSAPFDDIFVATVVYDLETHHDDAMIQIARVVRHEAKAEAEDRIAERKAELAGWRV